jgi:vacuolar-type H+-ATPase subunit F/Vma7
MSSIAAIGESDSIQIFRALGATLFETTRPEEVAEALNRCVRDEIQVVFITEGAYEQAREETDQANAGMLPAICVIPGAEGSRGLGMAALRKASHRAIGAEIR